MIIRLIFIYLLLFLFSPTFASAHNIDNQTTIHLRQNGFSPSQVKINQGEVVVFENTDQNPHWPASNIHPTHSIYSEFDPKKPIEPGQSWSFKFDKSGVWKYHDHLYPQLRGEIEVKEGEVKGVEGSKDQNLILKLFDDIKGFWNLLTDYFSQNNILGASPKFDRRIASDSEEIFKSGDALFSYVKKFGPKQTIQRLNQLTTQYGSCHDNAHKAGRFTYEIYKAEAFKDCSSECHSGCYHGATEAYFRDHGTNNLTEDLRIICSSELNPFFSHQCLHGIGHGLMAWSDYELFEALEACDMLEKGQASCWTGVFMENIVGGLTKDTPEEERKGKEAHLTAYLNSDPQYPCNIVDEKYQSSCYFLQTSRMMQLFQSDFKKISQACQQAPAQYQRSCFESMGRDVGGVHRGNSSTAIAACQEAPYGQLRTGCLIGAVQDSFWDASGQDMALKFCQTLADNLEKDTCYTTIFQRAPQVLTSQEDLKTFCAKAESYQVKCLSHVKI